MRETTDCCSGRELQGDVGGLDASPVRQIDVDRYVAVLSGFGNTRIVGIIEPLAPGIQRQVYFEDVVGCNAFLHGAAPCHQGRGREACGV